MAQEGTKHLQLPHWFSMEVGIGCFIGGLILIVPGLPVRIKEWAYVALGIVYVSALIAHLSVDGLVPMSFMPLVVFAVLLVSYSKPWAFVLNRNPVFIQKIINNFKANNELLKTITDPINFYKPVQPLNKKADGVQYVEFLPDGKLRTFIHCYWQLSTTRPLTDPFNYQVVADGCIDIYFNLERPEENFITGFCTGFTEFPLYHSFNYIGIRFLPGMFPLVFNINALELSGRTEELNAVLPDFSGFIKSRFFLTQNRCELGLSLDRYFLAKFLSIDKDPDPRIFRAINYIQKTAGLVNIEKDLNTGISSRQLRRLFEFYIGDTAKAFSQVIRFQRILQAKPTLQSLKEDKLFLDAGYYDQAHFIKEFKKLYGSTPGKLKMRSHSAVTRILSNSVYCGLIKIPKDKYGPEKFIKGIHQPLVAEVDFWNAQQLLGNITPTKVQPKNEFPLRGIIKCWCGQNMTAGYSKGKTKYYLYYRCIHHTEKNYRGELMHDQFAELLEKISFKPEQLEYISKKAASIINSKNGDSEVKWQNKFRKDIATLNADVEKASLRHNYDPMKQLETSLSKLSNMRFIYENASLEKKHSLIKLVFKEKIMYCEGEFRTPAVDPIFLDNSRAVLRAGIEPARLLRSQDFKSCVEGFRAKDEIRTRDPDLGKVVLYQLSYFRIDYVTKIGILFFFSIPVFKF
eukprot:gene13459-15861_t